MKCIENWTKLKPIDRKLSIWPSSGGAVFSIEFVNVFYGLSERCVGRVMVSLETRPPGCQGSGAVGVTWTVLTVQREDPGNEVPEQEETEGQIQGS